MQSNLVTNSKDVRVVKYDVTERRHIEPLINCYRQVFADPPWNEWKKCSNPDCPDPNGFWGKKDTKLLSSWNFRHCGMPLDDYWPRDQVRQDLEHELTDITSCWLCFDGEQVVGFCWGYPITLGELEEKLKTEIAISSQGDKRQLVAYQDEMGLIDRYRGSGLAKTMFLRRLDDFLSLGLKTTIVRTRELPNPSVTFSWFVGKLGYEVVARYVDGRVVLARPLLGLKELLH